IPPGLPCLHDGLIIQTCTCLVPSLFLCLIAICFLLFLVLSFGIGRGLLSGLLGCCRLCRRRLCGITRRRRSFLLVRGATAGILASTRRSPRHPVRPLHLGKSLQGLSRRTLYLRRLNSSA